MNMKSFVSFIIAVFVFMMGCATAPAQTQSVSAVKAELPPLLDRELFFGDPEISGAQISPDGRFISFIKPYNNVMNIWIKERGEPFDRARPLTGDVTRPVTSYFWARDSKYILYAQDKLGDENFRIYAVDPAVPGDPIPPARDLTPLEKVRASIIAVPRDTPNEIVVGLNDRNPQLHDVYRINLTTGERTLIRQNNENIAGWMTDQKGILRLGIRQTPDGGTEILKVDGENLVSIYSVNSEESVNPVRFTADGNRFYMATNKGDGVDKSQLELFDLSTGKAEFVEKDPLDEVDFGGVLFSDLTDKMLVTYYVGDRLRLYFKDKSFEEDFNILLKQIGEGNIGMSSMTKDEQVWVVSISRDVDPGSVYIFDRKKDTAELLYRQRPDLPSGYLAEMKPVRYQARDGLTIPAYLTLPKGIPAKNLPAVIFVHGGPWGRDSWGYHPIAQFLANRGYAVLMPNFRGSDGFGKKFLNAGNKQWGTGGMQHDITDGVQYLIREGIADPKKIAISGGSYGGYATLAGLAFTPDLYAAGFDVVGPSNIITLLKSIPPYWAPIKKIFSVRVGDMDDPKEREMLEKQSPLNSAKQITAPLYVVQGANDPRVKQAESDQIVVALRDLGRDIEYMVAPDEGHGFAGKENRLAMYTAMEKFLAKHIGGRDQKDVREAIKERLDSITVDVSTVELPEQKGQITPTAKALVFNPDLIKDTTLTYATNIETQGQKLAVDAVCKTSHETREGKALIRVVITSSGATGTGATTIDFDAGTLMPRHQHITQGTAKVELDFSAQGVTGKISMGAQDIPVNVKSDHQVMPSEWGTMIPVSTLPLEAGYAATIHQFDLMTMSAKAMIVKIEGTEKLTVRAGTFDSYKGQLTPVEGEGGGTFWIDTKTRNILKIEAKLPSMAGGGSVITELVK
jgi:dipeptidyl aminopeptidase/acylaminoacyl peptidase